MAQLSAGPSGRLAGEDSVDPGIDQLFVTVVVVVVATRVLGSVSSVGRKVRVLGFCLSGGRGTTVRRRPVTAAAGQHECQGDGRQS